MDIKKIKYEFKKPIDLLISVVVFIISIVRFLYYGLHYPHMLDDYIQYHNYSAFSDSKLKLLLESGLLGARPLAGVADLYVWSNFYGNMIFAAIIISIMYAAAVLLLYKLFSRHFRTSFFFIVICLLFPSGLEGIYWISASSRIAVGLFFLALSAFCLDTYFSSKQKKYAVAAYLFQFICFCFYEPVMLLSITLSVIVIIINKSSIPRTAVLTAVTIALAALYFAFTSFFIGEGVYSSRAQIILPVTPYYWDNFLPRVFDLLKKAYISAPILITFKGFIRGLKILIEDKTVLYKAFILLSSTVAFYIVRNDNKNTKKLFTIKGLIIQFVVGLLLAAAPISIHLVMSNPFVPLRGTVLSFPGAALMFEAVMGLIIREHQDKKSAITLKAVGTALCVCLFLTAGVSELRDYNQTEKDDLSVMEHIYPYIADKGEDEKITVLGIKQSYLDDQNYYYANHIHGVTESDWALSGALRAVYENAKLPYVIPLQQETKIYAPQRIEGSAAFYVWYNNEIKPAECVKTEDGYEFYYYDGQLCAQINDYSGSYWLSIYQ